MTASWRSFWPSWLLWCFCGGFCFVVFWGGYNQSVWLWLWWPQWHGHRCGWWHLFFCHGIMHSSMVFCGAIFVPHQHCFVWSGIMLCAAEQFFVPQCCFCATVVRGAFVPWHCALFCGNVISAAALCFVPQPSTMCCSIAPCAAFCAMALCFIPWSFFCAMALAMCHKQCFLCHGHL